ncbi:PHP domain-containing protein [Marinimicrobium agarilyticum]|uniref:PHP domain-containing protein n=1 Tax=Marinimicrobium agarilyticum TaxID=306546 RepID=UPI00041F0CF5|nr:PHP domain-containing protein [Marinimicrobium agarilyticum]
MFDLHSHSHCSDGILSPEALMSRAKAQGVQTLALTDHDTVAGVSRARAAARAEGLTLVSGIEFSSQWGRGGVHIVGLDIDIDSVPLQTAIERQQTARATRAEAIAERLERLGVPGALEGARALAGEAQIGRPHFAQFLVDRGLVKDQNAAFKKYLGAGKSADVRFQWPDMPTVVNWIHEAGGVAVLAHPKKYPLTRTKMCALVADFVEAGGDALEVISGQQPSGTAEDLARIATREGLAASCGSDFHRPDAPWQELGNFGPLPPGCQPVWELPGFTA